MRPLTKIGAITLTTLATYLTGCTDKKDEPTKTNQITAEHKPSIKQTKDVSYFFKKDKDTGKLFIEQPQEQTNNRESTRTQLFLTKIINDFNSSSKKLNQIQISTKDLPPPSNEGKLFKPTVFGEQSSIFVPWIRKDQKNELKMHIFPPGEEYSGHQLPTYVFLTAVFLY